jgi:hypothetical protein
MDRFCFKEGVNIFRNTTLSIRLNTKKAALPEKERLL